MGPDEKRSCHRTVSWSSCWHRLRTVASESRCRRPVTSQRYGEDAGHDSRLARSAEGSRGASFRSRVYTLETGNSPAPGGNATGNSVETTTVNSQRFPALSVAPRKPMGKPPGNSGAVHGNFFEPHQGSTPGETAHRHGEGREATSWIAGSPLKTRAVTDRARPSQGPPGATSTACP